MNHSRENELLLSVMRREVSDTLLRQQMDWDYVVATARAHGLLPLLQKHMVSVAAGIVPGHVLSCLKREAVANSQSMLHLVGRQIQVFKLFQEHDIQVAIKDAFAEIERQLKEYKSRFRGEHLWKRLSKRAEIRRMKVNAEHGEQRSREMFFSLVSPHLSKLYHLMRHVIHYSEAMGELTRGELEPEDVVDSTLVRAYREFLKGYPPQDIRSWLIRVAMDVLDAEVDLRKRDRDLAVHEFELFAALQPRRQVVRIHQQV